MLTVYLNFKIGFIEFFGFYKKIKRNELREIERGLHLKKYIFF